MSAVPPAPLHRQNKNLASEKALFGVAMQSLVLGYSSAEFLALPSSKL